MFSELVICKPFQGAQESIPSLAGRYDNSIWRRVPVPARPAK